jgi:Polyketide cyclase / dehydrase and lipid transport
MERKEEGMSERTLRAPEDAAIFESTVSVSCPAPAEVVYDLIADLSTHLEWNGRRQPRKTRLETLVAPSGPATVGTEFTSTGTDHSARFADRSVVTEADRPAVFEFVTEARRSPKRGTTTEMTNVNRYEIEAEGSGCRVTYRSRIVRIMNMPFIGRFPLTRKLVLAEGKKQIRSTLRNLSSVAQEKGGS